MLYDVTVRVDTNASKAAEIGEAARVASGSFVRSVKVAQVTMPFIVDGYDTKKGEPVQATVMATDTDAAKQKFETADVKAVRVTRGRGRTNG